MQNIYAQLEPLPYFTLAVMRQFTQLPDASLRVRLSRWSTTGKIIRLKRGLYMTKTFADRHLADREFMPAVSAILQPQSYLSREYVLQSHQVLTEATYLMTAMTTKNTQAYTNTFGSFSYSHVQAQFYSGFTIATYHGITYAVATKTKALFDYFLFRSLPVAQRRMSYNIGEDLRLNLSEWSRVEQDEFAQWCTVSASPKMRYILGQLRRFVWQQ